MLTNLQLSNLRVIADAAVSCELLTGIPADLLAAQCILESGWLKAAPANNCFGIKNFRGSYGRQLLPTKEWFSAHDLAWFLHLGDGRTASLVDPTLAPSPSGRRLYRVMDWFATFPDLKSCFNRRAGLFLQTPYSVLQAVYSTDHNFERYVRSLSPIYATAPNYADAVLSLVRQPEVADAITEARMSIGQIKV